MTSALDELSLGFLLSAIASLVVLSACFSGSETAMMAMNRYRLLHLARYGKGSSGARKAYSLLQRPDRLLAVILIGNNFVNFLAASLATVIAVRLVGDAGLALAPFVCTIVFLVFAEVAPKTISAAYPERVALPASHLLGLLLWLTYPLVWSVNLVTNGFLRLLGVSQPTGADNLSAEELRTVVYEGSQLAKRPQGMLLGVLDLAKMTVDDIMVPRNDIVGLDLEQDFDDLLAQLRTSRYTRLPVFTGEIEQLEGVLHMRSVSRFLAEEDCNLEALKEEITKPLFVPANTPLQAQLVHFQKMKARMSFVVNEYGELLGLVTLADLLEEIVGEFTTDLDTISEEPQVQEDGSCLIDGGALLRDVNRQLGWQLPEAGPKTLNGLITEFLEMIPEAPMCLRINGYRIEIVQTSDQVIRRIRVWPPRPEEQETRQEAPAREGPDD